MSPRRLRGQAGVTFVELMIAIVMTLVLVIIAGIIVLASQEAWSTGKEKLDMQQEATRCVEQIARDVRRARWVDYIDASEIRLRDHTGVEFESYRLVGGKVQQSGSDLVDFDCTGLTFNINPDTTTIEIIIVLEDEQENVVRVESKASIRNRNYTNL